jgi:dienelactone hydrolase
MARVAPYGTWASPLSAADVAAGGLRLGVVTLDGEDIYWLEGRPSEGGRNALVKRTPAGAISDVTPQHINVRSRVHEYGGDAYLVSGGVVYLTNFADQRVYRIEPGSEPRPITAEGKWFHADYALDSVRRRLICVREDHTGEGEPVNTIVAISLQPAAAGTYGAIETLGAGYDFYSTPRLSPDETMLSWLSWRHPNMPWDGTELWVADLTSSGPLANARLIAGGPRESIYQPGWSPDGALYYVSDRTGYWRIYRAHDVHEPNPANDPTVPNAPNDPSAEFGRPQWLFATSTWACAGPSTLVVSYATRGTWRLATVDLPTGEMKPLAPQLTPHDWMAATPAHAVLVAGSTTQPDALVRVDLESGDVETIRRASSVKIDEGSVSAGEPIEFPTTGGASAHALFYVPRNRDFTAPDGERPPLIVITHGGPTSAARTTLDLQIQFWTTRGFAVADVNYRGSSGYGRAYREALNGQWGIADVDDVIHAVRYLASRGSVDDQRAVIRGGSAGGYTTLAALTFHPGAFKAGASYYGISDLEVLEIDTHKFESQYSHSLIGPYPASRDVYHARSPVHAIDRLSCPLILFQGLEDKVVPPNQSEMMADAVRAKGLPVAYLAFEGEQHGFRRAETIIRSLEAELYFYGAVFGFSPHDSIPPVPIDNLR